MELLEVYGCYRDGQVILDETPKVVVSSQVKVTFLSESEAQSSKDTEREAAVQRLIASMKNKRDFGGGPYYRDRGELYEEE